MKTQNVGDMPVSPPRKSMPSPQLAEAEFKKRYLQQFTDPAFAKERHGRQ